MTDTPYSHSPPDPEYDVLDRAIADAEVQLRIMYNLRRRMERIAQAATLGALLGFVATLLIGGYIGWSINETGNFRAILTHPETPLLIEIGLLAGILAMSMFLWIRRLVARDGVAALEEEIATVRGALHEAVSPNDLAQFGEQHI